MTKLQGGGEPASRKVAPAGPRLCPDCKMEIPPAARRCGHCGSKMLSEGQKLGKAIESTIAIVILIAVVAVVLYILLLAQ